VRTALDELIDNSIEAGASTIHIKYLHPEKSSSKVNGIAVIDNGPGMMPKMLRHAVAWGGTHRADQRSGLGRFGFGLPSASVNQTRKYSVYSKVEGGEWHGITIDLDDIKAGAYSDEIGRIVSPEAEQCALPEKLERHISKNLKGFKSGTIVVWWDPDRIKWKTTTALQRNLITHFGVMFRNYIGQVKLVLNGVRVKPVDPLFITRGNLGFEENGLMAEALDPISVPVKDKNTGENSGVISVRLAAYRPGFYAEAPNVDKKASAKSTRFRVKNDHRGIIVCRMGRQIDVTERTPWKGLLKFSNDDRYWGCEIDFPAELDEEFTIANSKQGVVTTDRIWDLLEKAGVKSAILAARSLYRQRQKENDAEPSTPNPEVPRPSEESLANSEKFRKKKVKSSKEREEAAKNTLEKYLEDKSEKTGRDRKSVEEEFKSELKKRKYKVEFESIKGGNFYRIEQRGGLYVLTLNRLHRFYTDLYAASHLNTFHRSALEILIFTHGLGELDAIGNEDKTMFYHAEVREWSSLLDGALSQLPKSELDTDIAT